MPDYHVIAPDGEVLPLSRGFTTHVVVAKGMYTDRWIALSYRSLSDAQREAQRLQKSYWAKDVQVLEVLEGEAPDSRPVAEPLPIERTLIYEDDGDIMRSAPLR